VESFAPPPALEFTARAKKTSEVMIHTETDKTAADPGNVSHKADILYSSLKAPRSIESFADCAQSARLRNDAHREKNPTALICDKAGLL
jgi:hypothetical protein